MSIRIGRSKVKPDPDAWLRILDDMIDDDEYAFSHDFLKDVRSHVKSKRTITKKQMEGVQNVRRSTYL